MVIVRVAKGIGQHFNARASEWAMGVMLFLWGILVIHDPATMPPAFYHLMLDMAPAGVWGIACFSAGSLRLVALTVNGTFHDFPYSPELRFSTAFLSCFFWMQITLALFESGPPSTGMAVYPVLLALDTFNVYRTASDARIQKSASDARLT